MSSIALSVETGGFGKIWHLIHRVRIHYKGEWKRMEDLKDLKGNNILQAREETGLEQ